LTFNDTLNVAGSYYAATANGFAPAPALEGEASADICVIGGGWTGLSAALHLAERGYSVILLEAGRIGWGASGRNGGLLVPGLRKGAIELVADYGEAQARQLYGLAMDACDLLAETVERHGIACDLKRTGHLTAAAKPRHMAWFEAEAKCRADIMGDRDFALLDAREMQDELDAAGFHGGFLDRRGGHFHPLNYALGLASAARAAGVRLFEHSQVRRLDAANGVRAVTDRGEVRATWGVVAGDALLGDLVPALAARIMPIAAYVVATEALAAPPILRDRAVSNSRFVVDYFRLSAERRLIFGGGELYWPHPPQDIAAFVRPYLARIFPQLARCRIDHAWGGQVSITTTRLPHIGREGSLFFAHGYSGQGAILTTMAGKLIAEAVAGTAERFDILANVAPPAFPGGTRLRQPLHVLAMLWYALRDRL
jgi:gamma-glutamylputrescine oxidase